MAGQPTGEASRSGGSPGSPLSARPSPGVRQNRPWGARRGALRSSSSSNSSSRKTCPSAGPGLLRSRRAGA
eukprot:5364365-Alexandrium_andersonii.AAC.1